MPLAGNFVFHFYILVIQEALTRTIESTLRTMSNLIERLHASFFFYLLTSPSQFLKIGLYLPSAILISIALMFHGLSAWANAAWKLDESLRTRPGKSQGETIKWKRRNRPVRGSLSIIMATHTLGGVLFVIISSSWYLKHQVVQFFRQS